MLIVLSVIHVLICLAIIIAMYFHRGTDSLFSGGGGMAGMAGSAMPKTILTPLDKIIAVFVGLFFISTVLLNYAAHKEGKIEFSMDSVTGRHENSDAVKKTVDPQGQSDAVKSGDLPASAPSAPVAQ